MGPTQAVNTTNDIIERDFSLVPAGGINVSVNPLLNKEEDMLMLLNVYSPRFGRKRVRFGYTPMLDKISSSPVENLIYFNFPNGNKGILQHAGGKLYKYDFTGSTWGSSIKTLTTSTSLFANKIASTIMLSTMHLSSQSMAFYLTYDGSTFTTLGSSANVPYSDFLTNWRSRVYSAKYTLSSGGAAYYSRLKFSSVDFIGTGDTPWQEVSTDPSSSGSLSVNAGNDGIVTGLDIAGDRPFVYKEFGLYKYNGTGVIRAPFQDGAMANTVSNTEDTNYFFNSDGVWFNNGDKTDTASFSIIPIIQSTFDKYGFDSTKIHSIGWKFYFMLYVDKIYWQGKTYNNAMFVYDKRFDEWYMWTLGHQMTCFSWFIDPTTKAKLLMSGDVNGNTYLWGNDYCSDATKPITFDIQGKHTHMAIPSYLSDSVRGIADDKRIIQYYTLTDFGSEANLYLIYDKTRDPVQIGWTSGFMKSMQLSADKQFDFKTVSYKISGSTTTNRGSLDGIIFTVQNEGNRTEGEEIH